MDGPDPAHQLRATHRKKNFRTQTSHVQIRPITFAVANRQINAITLEGDVLQRSTDAQVRRRMRADKIAEARHQPLGSEVGRHAHGQDVIGTAARQRGGARAQTRQCVLNKRQIDLPVVAERNAARTTVKQPYVETLLKLANLMAHRALGLM